jgi:hypothetical protein
MRGLGLGLGWSLGTYGEALATDVPVNVVAPTVTGTVVQGTELACSAGIWSQIPFSFTYQWQRDGVDIGGATSQTYTTGGSDHGKAIGCVVTAHNAFGASSATASSNTIGPIIVAPVNSVAPAITGTTGIGDTLTCSTGTWSDTPTSYAYQWKRDTVAIVGANASTYVLVTADDTHSITCTVTATNLAGSTAATSNAVTGGASGPVNTVAPEITGGASAAFAYAGQTLACDDGTWTGTPTSFTYQWTSDGVDIGGETANTYAVVLADETHTLDCIVTAHNAGGDTPASSQDIGVLVWSPNAFGANLLAWYNASKLQDGGGSPISVDGTSIKRLVDNSPGGTNYHDYAVAAGTFPKYRKAKTDTNFGPADCFEFDGTQVITVPAPAISLSQPFTVWVVARSDVGDKAQMGGLGAWALFIASGSGQQAYQAGSFRGSTVVNLGLWSIVIMRFDNAGSPKLRVDGTTAATATPGTGAGSSVGIGDYAWGGNAMTGFMADAGVVDGAVSDADIARLEHYLSVTYGVDSL